MARRSRQIRIFESSIERLGRILSSKWKVKVVFKHGACETDGSTIYLPVLPDNADKALMDAMQGYLDHETAHVVFTDFKAFGSLRKKPKLLTMVNALEDRRIEKEWVQMWRGSAVNFKNSHEWARQKIVVEREEEDENGQMVKTRPYDGLSDFGKFVQAAICFDEHHFGQHWFLQQVIEPEILKRVVKCEDLFRQAWKADDTAGLIPIAVEILDRIQEEDEEVEEVNLEDLPDDARIIPPGMGLSPQQQAMNKSPQDPNAPPVYQMAPSDEDEDLGSGGVPQPGQQDSNQTGEPEQSGGVHSSSEVEDGDEILEPQNSEGEPSINTQLTPDFMPTAEELEADEDTTSLAEMLKQAAVHSVAEDDCYLVYTTEGDKVEKIKEGNKCEYKNFMKEATRMVSVMKRTMTRSLLSSKVSRWECGKNRGKINPRAIHRVVSGTSKKVFRQKVESEAHDTAVLMMVDHSGSMAGGRLDLAAKTAIVFGGILHQLDIPFSVLGFSTEDGGNIAHNRQRNVEREEQEVFARWGNLWIGQYKGFSESWTHSGHRVINMRHNCRYNTYDGESLRYGARVLMARPEKRKILFWLNDGQPCPNRGDDREAHERFARDAAKEVEKMVELFAIGIQTDAVKQYYSNCVTVNALKDVPATAFRELDALIRKGKTLKKAAS